MGSPLVISIIMAATGEPSQEVAAYVGKLRHIAHLRKQEAQSIDALGSRLDGIWDALWGDRPKLPDRCVLSCVADTVQ